MEIYRGLAAGHCGHEELIDFLNYVFGMNGADSGFYRLLPKLYKPENRPEDYNYVVLEDGKLRAAVGAYPIELEVAGHVLRGAGIGNVAVHPFHRRKGYMKDAMGQAMEAILQSGADFAALGGQRQRYSYFGFEPAGLCGTFSLNSANLRHALPGAGEGYAARKIGPEDAAALEAIRAMTERQASHPLRPQEKLYDVLNTWESQVCVVDGPQGGIAGYFLAKDGNDVPEIDCAAPEHAAGVLCACYAFLQQERLSLHVPFHAQAMFDLLGDVAERASIESTECYNVLCYERVLRACLELKAQRVPLADGAITFAIQGYAGPERLRVAVSGGKPEVAPAAEGEALILTHRQAMNLFFGPWSPERLCLPAFAAGWFPLSLFVPEVDND